MASSKVWADLSINQIFQFQSLDKPSDRLRYLAKIFRLHGKDQKDAILLDFYYYNLVFAQEHKFTPEKSSAFFSIMKDVHSRNIQTTHLKLDEDFTYFKELLLKHCINRPPFSEKIFEFQDGKIITEYAVQTYFRHYSLYKYAFTKKVKLLFNCDESELYKTQASIADLKFSMDKISDVHGTQVDESLFKGSEASLHAESTTQSDGGVIGDNNAVVDGAIVHTTAETFDKEVNSIVNGSEEPGLETKTNETLPTQATQQPVTAQATQQSAVTAAVGSSQPTIQKATSIQIDPILSFDPKDPQQQKELALQYVKSMVEDSINIKFEELKAALLKSKLDDSSRRPSSTKNT